MSSIKDTWKSLAPALLVCAAVIVLAPNSAWARKAHKLKANGPDPTPVSACGTLAGNNVIYQVTADISTAATGTCITLSGSNSAFDLHGFTISGPGGSSTGSGIAITGSHDVVEGINGLVMGFKVGVTDTGTGTAGDDINLSNNGTGLLVSNSRSNRWANLEATGNSNNGIYVFDCDEFCSISDFFSNTNGANGILVVDSNDVKVDLFITDSNVGDGVHIGLPCSQGPGCKRDTNIRVVDGFSGSVDGMDPFGPNGGSGIVLDQSEAKAQDQVSLVQSSGQMIDLFDATQNCGSNPFNLWFANDYDTSQAGTTSPATCMEPSIPL